MIMVMVMIGRGGECSKVICLLQVVEPEEVFSTAGVSVPHTTHCLGTGEVMISTLGNVDGSARGREPDNRLLRSLVRYQILILEINSLSPHAHVFFSIYLQ